MCCIFQLCCLNAKTRHSDEVKWCINLNLRYPFFLNPTTPFFSNNSCLPRWQFLFSFLGFLMILYPKIVFRNAECWSGELFGGGGCLFVSRFLLFQQRLDFEGILGWWLMLYLISVFYKKLGFSHYFVCGKSLHLRTVGDLLQHGRRLRRH